MTYKQKELCRIRTITTFLTLTQDKASWRTSIEKAILFCSDLSRSFLKGGYEVQSVRIVTNPFGEYLNTESGQTAYEDLQIIRELLEKLHSGKHRIRFAIGEAKTEKEIALIPELIRSFGDLCNACVNISKDKRGVMDNAKILDSARVVSEISKITPRGEGNFNFTVNFNCDSYIPYFPASYHRSKEGDCYVIGLETPDLLLNTLKEINKGHRQPDHNTLFKTCYDHLSQALQYHITTVTSMIDKFAGNQDFSFAGIDSSAAPSKNCSSMTEVFKELGVDYFGASGTVEASSLLTSVFKSIRGVNLMGFSGLMLAVTEDRGLAEGTRRSEFDIRSLLTYSAVCGIGLDTVPVPGDTSILKISALMRDTGTLAYRLNKPLTVRLFPVPGLKAGDMTSFESDDLCNCAVLNVP